MSTETVSVPSISHGGRRRVLVVVLATLAAIGVVAAAIAATSGGQPTVVRSANVRARTSPECGVEIEYLAAELGTMPAGVRAGVIAGLSPDLQQLVDTTVANQARTGVGGLVHGFAYTPPVPDGTTLARVLLAIPPADARLVANALSEEQLAALDDGASRVRSARLKCP